ncbi:MAG: tetratricopeptide repeat protein [Bryobacteraceae bacterium]
MLLSLLTTLLLAPPPQSVEELERQAEERVRTEPTAENWQRVGLARFLRNHFEPAIPAFQEALRRNSTLWPSHLFLGISRYRTNQFGTALESLQTAKRLAPKDAPGVDDVDYWLGASLLAVKRPWDSLRALEQLLARKPDHRDALATAARAYADLGGALWNDVAERNFDTPQGWEIHGHALESESNIADALEAYRKSGTRDGTRSGPTAAVARLLLTQGKTVEALQLLERKRPRWMGEPQMSYLAGLALLQLGRTAEAAPLIENAARWTPYDVEAWVALAQVFLALRETRRAVEAARKAAAVDPSSPAAHELLLAALQMAEDASGMALERQRWDRAQTATASPR